MTLEYVLFTVMNIYGIGALMSLMAYWLRDVDAGGTAKWWFKLTLVTVTSWFGMWLQYREDTKR